MRSAQPTVCNYLCAGYNDRHRGEGRKPKRCTPKPNAVREDRTWRDGLDDSERWALERRKAELMRLLGIANVGRASKSGRRA